MTTQTTSGPSTKQLLTLQKQARAAGVSDEEWAAKVGGTSLQTLAKDQIDVLFTLAYGGESRANGGGESRQTTNSTAVARREPLDLTAMERVLSTYGYKPEEAAVVMKVIGGDLDEAEVRYAVTFARNHQPPMDLLNKDVYAVKMQGRVQMIPAVDWTRAVTFGELDGPVTIEYCHKPEHNQAPVWLSLANFGPDDRPHAGRATGYRKASARPYVFEGLYSEHHRTGNAWDKYDLHMFGLALERQLLRHMCPDTLRGLDLETPPVDELENAARSAMWAEATEHGYDHDTVHLMIFGIAPEASLRDELERRGMDWRDAANFVRARVAGHGDRPALPPGLRTNTHEDADALYAGNHDDPMALRPSGPVDIAMRQEALREAAASTRLDGETQVANEPEPDPSPDGSYEDFRAGLEEQADALKSAVPDPVEPNPGSTACHACGAPSTGFDGSGREACDEHGANFVRPLDPPTNLLPLPSGADGGLTAFVDAARLHLDLNEAEVKRRITTLGSLTWRNVEPSEWHRRWAAIQTAPAK